METTLDLALAAVTKNLSIGSTYRPEPVRTAPPVASTCVDPYACCAAAVPLRCVCVAAFTCPAHGERHRGSHE